ncbi:Uncharacterised protein [Yersinia kristensenii]|nr:Uncharacterised protein [Yersinia kristensenii]
MKFIIKLLLSIEDLSSLNIILKTIYHLVQYYFPLPPIA